MVDLDRLKDAAEKAAEVDARLRASFAAEGRAADELLCAVVRIALIAFGALAERIKFFGEEKQRLVFLASRDAEGVRWQLYLTAAGALLEDKRVYGEGYWKLVDLKQKPTAEAARDYSAERVAARVLDLCAGVEKGKAGERTYQANARAERLRAAAVLLDAVGGLK